MIDSGVVAGHPLLANWVIEERDFHTGEATAVDLNGHGTAVAGLVAYGDIASCLESNRWEPRVRICSAKVLRNQPNLLQPDRPEAVFPDQSDKRIESVTEEAIRYFHGQGCRVFNLSVGDASKVYSDQRQFSWAELLDDLTRELDIVIVVSTGNNNQPQIPDVPHTRDRFRKAVREQTLQDRVTSPATAALALTVGSLARSEGLPAGTIAMTAGAPEGGPSPFTRTGPGYAMRPTSKGIKPDVVDFGGNFGLQAMTPAIKRWAEHPALGEPSLQRDYVNRAVRMFFGTSYAAPHVTHAAALAECALRDALGNAPSACLIRAAVGAACAIPAAPRGWYTDEGKRCKMIGYGRPVLERIPWSTDNDARLVAMDDVEENKFHLYRVPIPADFIAVPGPKGITIALAFDPPVRGSRKMYMARTMSFYPMLAVTIQDAHEALSRFDGNQDEEEEPRLPPERQLRMTPGSRRVAYSALQVRRAEWGAEDDLPAMVDGSGESALTVAVFCQQRFATDPLETRQRYGLVVDFWHAGQETRLYEPLRARVRPRLRQQARI
ncbi:MAG: S8 family peptidase [Terriglobales bacterium]